MTKNPHSSLRFDGNSRVFPGWIRRLSNRHTSCSSDSALPDRSRAAPRNKRSPKPNYDSGSFRSNATIAGSLKRKIINQSINNSSGYYRNAYVVDVGSQSRIDFSLDWMQFKASDVDARFAVLVSGRHVRTGLNQELDKRSVPLRNGQQQRRLSPIVQRIYAALALNQQQLGHLTQSVIL